ncbi:DUF6207 family protein [Streptomyces sp. NPDC087437]|uniref:DUF6207 family protein n=1 Tax=Streptomyces sp. NPDC087437 TaxID=3365789 RepID=UPI00382DB467
MDSINEVHVSEPGLVVVDVAAADDATGLAFQQLLAGWWATALAQHSTRDVGEPGVRLRCYLGLRQPFGPAAPDEPVSAAALGDGRVPGSARHGLHRIAGGWCVGAADPRERPPDPGGAGTSRPRPTAGALPPPARARSRRPDSGGVTPTPCPAPAARPTARP